MKPRYVGLPTLQFMKPLSLAAFITFFISCADKRTAPDLRNRYTNDLEGYEGWIGISGYYNLNNGDARSGRHAFLTDSLARYSISYAIPMNTLSEKPIKKINAGVWVKCLANPSKGSFIVSFENGDKIIKYFSFDLDEKKPVMNEWIQLKGTAVTPIALPKDAVLKIYFWNKGTTAILVDDFEFEIEN